MNTLLGLSLVILVTTAQAEHRSNTLGGLHQEDRSLGRKKKKSPDVIVPPKDAYEPSYLSSIPMNSLGHKASKKGRKKSRGQLPPTSEFVENSSIDLRFGGMDYLESFYIPASPMGAAGPESVIQVVNVAIQALDKNGTELWTVELESLFGSVVEEFDQLFSPKIVYDIHEDRFVLSVFSIDIFPGFEKSRILLAVSSTNNPGLGDWFISEINSKVGMTFADHPGIEVDEEAVYVTASMFTFPELVPDNPFAFDRSLLWIVDKGATGGFYSGGPVEAQFYDFEGSNFFSYVPAEIRSESGAGEDVGTYLVSYSGLATNSTGELQQLVAVVRVNNPLNGTSFTLDVVELEGVIDEEAELFLVPGMPQLNENRTVDAGDRTALDAAWHDNSLWVTTTMLINGETTATYIKLNTSEVADASTAPGAITLDHVGFIDGEDISPATFTAFPSVAVNSEGVAAFGFSASSDSMYVGSYVTYRMPDDEPGTLAPTEINEEGEAPYFRTFNVTTNRWGTYSGMAVDPIEDSCFWANNMYAALPCDPYLGETGCWNTSWARLCVQPSSSADPGVTKKAGKRVGK